MDAATKETLLEIKEVLFIIDAKHDPNILIRHDNVLALVQVEYPLVTYARRSHSGFYSPW